MQPTTLPIGYWIKQADQLLTKGIDEIQSAFGLTRTGWQALHSISETPGIEKSELIKILLPFAQPETLESTLAAFTTAALIHQAAEKLNLTPKGIDLHEACFIQQKLFRQKIMTGIPGEEYERTVLTLQKIVNNIINKP